jgi:LEA14-like dessication related protein
MRKLALIGMTVTAIAGVGCASLGRQSFAEPVVTFKDVRINGLGLTGGSLDVVLNVYNPNNFRLDATKLTYALLVDTLLFGSGEMDSRFTVQEKDSSEVRIPLDFRWAGMNQAARELLNTGSVPYRVRGAITVGSGVGTFTIPYDRTGRFSSLGGAR